jgi:hypothetical protein
LLVAGDQQVNTRNQPANRSNYQHRFHNAHLLCFPSPAFLEPTVAGSSKTSRTSAAVLRDTVSEMAKCAMEEARVLKIK